MEKQIRIVLSGNYIDEAHPEEILTLMFYDGQGRTVSYNSLEKYRKFYEDNYAEFIDVFSDMLNEGVVKLGEDGYYYV